MVDKKTQGKKNREAGQRFEVKVRKDLESKGWIVDRWSNNVDCGYYCKKCGTKSGYAKGIGDFCPNKKCENLDFGLVLKGKLISAKSRFGLRTTGFPDFICFRRKGTEKDVPYYNPLCEVRGVECKSNGYLDKEEREKCKWLLENNIFSKILIAKKSKRRGEIVYEEFKV